MIRLKRAWGFLSALLMVPALAKADVVNVSGTPILNNAQFTQSGYLTLRNLTINGWTPESTGPNVDATFNLQYARYGQTFSTNQNWSSANMITFIIQNLENRPVRFVFGCTPNSDLNNFNGGMVVDFTVPASSTKRYAIVFSIPGTEQYRMKVLPQPFDNDYTVITNEFAYKVANVHHWRFSLQDTLPARVRIRELQRVNLSYDLNNIVDQFFQYTQNSWPTKILSSADFLVKKTLEDADLTANPGNADLQGSNSLPPQAPSDRWKLTRYNNKWYFVAPSGKLFWSLGLTGVHPSMATTFTNREYMFSSIPQPGGPNGDLYTTLRDKDGNNVQGYYVVRHNLKQKFGSDYFAQWRTWSDRRMKSWGINTLGPFSDDSMEAYNRPYMRILETDAFPTRLVTPYKTWEYPPDVFASNFQSWATTYFTQQLAVHNARQTFMGVQVDNEMAWGHLESTRLVDKHSIAVGALNAPANQPAKMELIRQLTSKYRTISKLNFAWRTSYSSFNAMNFAHNITMDSQISSAMEADFRSFTYRYASAYFSKVRAALTASGLKGLYFGCRFWHRTPEVLQAAVQTVDVLCFNDYALPAQIDWNFYNTLARPVLISEWSAPVNDEGTFGFYSLTQSERAEQMQTMLNTAISKSNFVGLHLVEMYDQPMTNRGMDYENMGFGLVEITDTPRPQLVNVLRSVSSGMYSRRVSAP
jgi:hypothetical protein